MATVSESLTRLVTPPLEISPARRRAARLIAVAADAVQLVLFPLFGEGFASPLDDALDLAVGVLLVKLLGFHWVLLPAAGAELVPGVDLAPTWTAAVLIITGPGKKLRWILLAALMLIAAGVAIYLWRR